MSNFFQIALETIARMLRVHIVVWQPDGQRFEYAPPPASGPNPPMVVVAVDSMSTGGRRYVNTVTKQQHASIKALHLNMDKQGLLPDHVPNNPFCVFGALAFAHEKV